MSAKRGRFEAYFTVPAGETITFDDSVAAAQVLAITTGVYTITTLVAFLVANVVGGGHWTITFSGGESGTGKITIDCSDRPFTVTWSSSTLRDLMGFAANIAAVSAAQTGTKNARGVWLPDVEKWTPHGDDDGNGNAAVKIVAKSATKGPTGLIKTIVGATIKEFRGVRWTGVSRARTKLIGDMTAGVDTYQSFERWWGDTQNTEHAWFQGGAKFRFYWDADLTVYTDVKMVDSGEFDPARLVENWVGRYVIAIPTLVVQ